MYCSPVVVASINRSHALNQTRLGVLRPARIKRTQEKTNQTKKPTMRLITIALMMVATLATAHAEDRKRERKRHESHNYIIERQQAGQVSGVPSRDGSSAGARSIFIATAQCLRRTTSLVTTSADFSLPSVPDPASALRRCWRHPRTARAILARLSDFGLTFGCPLAFT